MSDAKLRWESARKEFIAKSIDAGVSGAQIGWNMRAIKRGVTSAKQSGESQTRQVGYFQHIRRTYGLTKGAFLRMLTRQDSRCDGCGRQLVLFSSDRTEIPVVDHDHVTGKVRALVCSGCNVRIGRVEFSATSGRYTSAREYVERHKGSGPKPDGDGPT